MGQCQFSSEAEHAVNLLVRALSLGY
jgi:hypothetical protein